MVEQKKPKIKRKNARINKTLLSWRRFWDFFDQGSRTYSQTRKAISLKFWPSGSDRFGKRRAFFAEQFL